MNEHVEDAEVVEPEEQAPEAEQSPYPDLIIHEDGISVGGATFPPTIVKDTFITTGPDQSEVTLTFYAENVLIKSGHNNEITITSGVVN